MRQIAVFLCILVFNGCSARVVSLNHKGNMGPVDQKDGGTVEYLDEGAAFVRNKRREDAYEKMHFFCKGQYRIVKEETRFKISALSDYKILHFECVKPE